MRKKKLVAGILSLSLLMTGSFASASESFDSTVEMNPAVNEAADETQIDENTLNDERSDAISSAEEETETEALDNSMTDENSVESDNNVEPNGNNDTVAAENVDLAGEDSFENLIILDDTTDTDFDVENEDVLFEAAEDEEDAYVAPEDAPLLSEDENNIIEIKGEARFIKRTLRFGEGVDTNNKLRYQITLSDPNMEINLRHEDGRNYPVDHGTEYPDQLGFSVRGEGTAYINGYPGDVFTLAFASEKDTTVSLTLKKGVIDTIEEVDPPDLMVVDPFEFEFEELAYNQLQVKINYMAGYSLADADKTHRLEEFARIQRDQHSSMRTYYADPDCSPTPLAQNDLKTLTAGTRVYAPVPLITFDMLIPGDYGSSSTTVMPAPFMSYTASFIIKPLDPDSLDTLLTDNVPLTVTKNGSRLSSMIKLHVEAPGLYEVVTTCVDAVIFQHGSGPSFGGYDPSIGLGLAYTFLTAGDYYVMVSIREYQSWSNFPDTGTIRIHKAALIKSVGIEVTREEGLTWNNWGDHIKKVFTYVVPGETGETTYKAGVDEIYPKDSAGHYFPSCFEVEKTNGVDRWKLRLYQDYEDSFRELYPGYSTGDPYGGYFAGYSVPDPTERVLTIHNVLIAGNANASVGAGTNDIIDDSMENVLDDEDGSTLSGEAAGKLQQLKQFPESFWRIHFSANMEVSAGASQDMAPVMNQLGAGESVSQVLNINIVVRSNTEPIGTIIETNREVEVAATVSNYDASKKYSILSNHNGVAKKLTVFRVERVGSGAKLWFKSREFSSFAVVETVEPQASTPVQQAVVVTENITIPKKPSLKKPKVSSKGKVTVNWTHFAHKKKKAKKIWKMIRKVELQYSTDSSFNTDVQSILIGKGQTKKTLKGLKKNTPYYVRIRYTDGTGGYSNWSKARTVKVKEKAKGKKKAKKTK